MSIHSTPHTLKVAVAPDNVGDWIADAVREGGGRVVPAPEAEALVWGGRGPDGLRDALDHAPHITWVQLPSAGVERYSGLLDDRHTWTCAKGIYAQPVAEHALALTLAGLHRLPELARTHSWRRLEYRDLSGGAVTILGGGGIAAALLNLLAPFHVTTTMVRRHPEHMPGAARVVGSDALHDALAGADAVILALALTPETERIIGAPELRAMKGDAWLVNVGRGKLIDTDALVEALREGVIGGAALDVTDPEPLPASDPLLDAPNLIVLPHIGSATRGARERMTEMAVENLLAGLDGRPMPHQAYVLR
jgi:phosphoglycerate dehydrogenase-like enzyme